jgi:hypothetical protein
VAAHLGVEHWAGGAAIITAKAHNWRAARGFKGFMPHGKWWKCPDCPAAVRLRRQVLDHMDLHRRAGDYDLPDDESEAENG